MEREPGGIEGLVGRLGGHPAQALGLDLQEGDLGAWWVAACLLSARGREETALEAFRGLAARDLAHPQALAAADPLRVEAALGAAGLARPQAAAATLVRSARTLAERYGGSFERLSAGADDLEDLAVRLAGLSPGAGRATVARFLRPLRERWPAARELPLAPAARAAALHLSLLRPGEDEEGEPSALRRALAGRDLDAAEAALERLGRAACLRERRARCPLGDRCPVRS